MYGNGEVAAHVTDDGAVGEVVVVVVPLLNECLRMFVSVLIFHPLNVS
jgi:hypothetical protein